MLTNKDRVISQIQSDYCKILDNEHHEMVIKNGKGEVICSQNLNENTLLEETTLFVNLFDFVNTISKEGTNAEISMIGTNDVFDAYKEFFAKVPLNDSFTFEIHSLKKINIE